MTVIKSCNFLNGIRYRRKAAMYDERIRELNEVSQAADEIKKNHDELRKKRFVLL